MRTIKNDDTRNDKINVLNALNVLNVCKYEWWLIKIVCLNGWNGKYRSIVYEILY